MKLTGQQFIRAKPVNTSQDIPIFGIYDNQSINHSIIQVHFMIFAGVITELFL